MDAETQGLVTPRGGRRKKNKKYQRGQGKYEILVKRPHSPYWYVRVGETFKSTEETQEDKAFRKAIDLIKNNNKPKRNWGPVRKTFDEVYHEFLDDKQAHIDFHSYRNHYVYPYSAIEDYIADKFIDEVDQGLWKTIAKDIRKKHPSRHLVAYHNLINSTLKFARDKKYLRELLPIELDRNSEKKPDIDPYSSKEVALARKNSEGTLNKLIRIMSTRGPRPFTEARLLRTAFFNFDEEVIELPGFLDGHRYTKNGEPRNLPMGKLKKEFRSWVKQAPGEFVMFDPKDPSKPVSEEWLRREWESLRAAIGLSGGLYRLRHYAAVTMLKAGINPITVAKIMGHNIKVLYKTYSRFLTRDLVEQVLVLDE